MQNGTNAAEQKRRDRARAARKRRLIASAHSMTAALRAREARAHRLAREEETAMDESTHEDEGT